MALMDRLTGAGNGADTDRGDESTQDDEIRGRVVWEVYHWVDDYDGPGWKAHSLKGEVERRDSKSKAVEEAFRMADRGDVIQIYDRDGGDPNLEYVN